MLLKKVHNVAPCVVMLLYGYWTHRFRTKTSLKRLRKDRITTSHRCKSCVMFRPPKDFQWLLQRSCMDFISKILYLNNKTDVFCVTKFYMYLCSLTKFHDYIQRKTGRLPFNKYSFSFFYCTYCQGL